MCLLRIHDPLSTWAYALGTKTDTHKHMHMHSWLMSYVKGVPGLHKNTSDLAHNKISHPFSKIRMQETNYLCYVCLHMRILESYGTCTRNVGTILQAQKMLRVIVGEGSIA
jgi:hypothetical protein